MPHDTCAIAIKPFFGGTMVMLFAVIGHVLRPNWFAGISSDLRNTSKRSRR